MDADFLSTPPPYSVRSLAERWACSEGLVRKAIADGRLDCFRIGTLVRIPVAEVERFEGHGAPPPAAEAAATRR